MSSAQSPGMKRSGIPQFSATDQTSNPYRLLTQACKDNNIPAVSDRIDYLIHKEPGNDTYITQWALRRALSHGNHEVVRYLFHHRSASLEDVTPNSLTDAPSIALFETALAHDHGAGVEDGVRDPEVFPCPALLESVAWCGTVSTFKMLRSRGAELGKRMLHRAVASAAAAHGRLDLPVRMEMVRFLIDEVGCDVNALDTKTQLPMHFGTPVTYAARVPGGKEVVAFLLGKGADPRIKDCWGIDNALSWAETYGNKEVFELLREWTQGLESGGRSFSRDKGPDMSVACPRRTAGKGTFHTTIGMA